ncbi:MAG: asparagine synthase B [Lachnospiraceae bacterium]|nr:asparagine synthase B [Lachnospiraceae bacterium]
MCSIMAWCRQGADQKLFQKALDETISRGPDADRILEVAEGLLGFRRLSIMGLTEEGMQPFVYRNCAVVCNGEIYGFSALRDCLKEKGYTFQSDSDCEILLPLYFEYGVDMFAKLDAEFACVLFDGETGEFIAARDPIGIRPLYYTYDKEGAIVFGSEPKMLQVVSDEKIYPFPPGHYYKDGKFTCYCDIAAVEEVSGDDLETVCANIRGKLIAGVEKRLIADAKVGFLLSGGLDSSLVCSIAARKSTAPIRTFAIGMDIDAIDLKYAKQTAEFLGCDHTEVIITRDDVIKALPEVIHLLGTYDITTIRASMGMYLLCKAIHEQTDIRVLLTGEVSDEIFGYKYTDFAPSAQAFQEEAQKRVRELHMYDVLRADRCISVNSLEARVPFGDLDFVKYCMAIDPEMKRNHYNKGKYLLRHAFEGEWDGKAYLPDEILFREKAAFSDAVGHSMVNDLKEYAEEQYTDAEFEAGCAKYEHARPFTKESLLYREIFEQFYPGQSQMVKDFWMPNKEWEGCDVNDPSARVLANYGDSGK